MIHYFLKQNSHMLKNTSEERAQNTSARNVLDSHDRGRAGNVNMGLGRTSEFNPRVTLPSSFSEVLDQ